MKALVTVRDGEARASSQDVATTFGKAHKDVLRAIDGLIDQEPGLSQRNFAPRTFQNRGRDYRCFEMNRDGFALLAMGFTGAAALKWKLAYIDAFNRMEQQLAEAAANDDAPLELSPELMDQSEAWRAALQLVREARIIGGRAAAQRAWALAGLPDIFSEEAKLIPAFQMGEAHRPVSEWINERCEIVPGHRAGSGELYADFEEWCLEKGQDPRGITSFGRLLNGFGIGKVKSDKMYRSGLRLRAP